MAGGHRAPSLVAGFTPSTGPRIVEQAIIRILSENVQLHLTSCGNFDRRLFLSAAFPFQVEARTEGRKAQHVVDFGARAGD